MWWMREEGEEVWWMREEGMDEVVGGCGVQV